ncbi:hypothetical protein BYT27DRAFT_7259268 [Phlegmacium glaucopus]|nr:hypothetical protein BYT27DRAFT_7259268 [Phlegmacium glaucopus]
MSLNVQSTTTMPPWTRSKNPAATRKRQVSNVDETANKCPKTSDNEGAGEINKGEKKPPKGKANRKLSKCLGGQRVSTPHLTKTELELHASGISVAPPERTRSAAIVLLAPPQAFAHSHDKHNEEQDDEEHNNKDNNKYNEQDNAQDNVQDNVQDNDQDNAPMTDANSRLIALLDH